MWQQASSYPDPRVEILDERFRDMVVTHAAVERLHTGMRWAEGPVWFGDMRCLLWSDIPNSQMLKWEEETGSVSVFRRGPFTNGNTPRPAGAAGVLRTRPAPGDTDRDRWHGDRAGRQL